MEDESKYWISTICLDGRGGRDGEIIPQWKRIVAFKCNVYHMQENEKAGYELKISIIKLQQ